MTITILSIVCAGWCYILAKRQGRNCFLAMLFGLFFTLFAVFGYYIAGNK